jgi:hypothetical protein
VNHINGSYPVAFGRNTLLAVGGALSTSVWIAICAAAPEFIWGGVLVTVGHFSQTDLFAGLLIGLILAFFVQPLLDTIRRLVGRHGAMEHRERRGALFTVCLSMAFALVSVSLHDALKAFVSGSSPDPGIGDAMVLTEAWAIVPFTVTVAWLSRGYLPLAIATGMFAIFSPFLTAWLFSWPMESAIATAIPTIFIVFFGYSRNMGRRNFTSSAFRVAIIAMLWLAFAAASNWATHLYEVSWFWIDLRFYAGWILGLLLAPYPEHELFDHGSGSRPAV